ncbi:MAG TPA: indole-3-glycerol-phosphate synthase, partial [Methanoregula sp.]|nr:indole-3-glycerol-phosphate synthase [Methanoregula sp.]
MNVIDEIIRRTQKRVAKLPSSFSESRPGTRRSLARAVRDPGARTAVIAEIKCASPSRGVIRRNVDMPGMARVLEGSGCVALSILTEPCFFGGSVRDIPRVRAAVDIPVLRKDFIIDERQLGESRAIGADAVLLIAAVLGEDLHEYVDLAGSYGLESLVEIHNEGEAESALATGAGLIGINNRDLATLTVDRSTTRRLSGPVRKAGRLIVSESGMRSPDDVREMKPYCDAFLIGSS